MENNLIEEQKEEAIRSIKKLIKKYNLDNNILEQFKKGTIIGFDNVKDNRPQEELDLFAKLINDFKEKKGAVIYAYIISKIKYDNQEFETLNILYVSKYKEDWDIQMYLDRDDVYVYSYNLNIPDYSEFGYIHIGVDDNKNLIRIY